MKITEKQEFTASALLRDLGGTVHVLIVHDTGTYQNFIKPNGDCVGVDVDQHIDVPQFMDDLRVSPDREN